MKQSKDTKAPVKRKDSFVLYTSHWETISQLPDKERLALFDAIFTYQKTGQVLELSQLAKLAFGFIKTQLDVDQNKYEAIVKRNRENGIKGGRPPNYQGDNNNPKNPDGYQWNPNEDDNENEYVNVDVDDFKKPPVENFSNFDGDGRVTLTSKGTPRKNKKYGGKFF